MEPRRVKQIIFGILYVCFLLLVISGIYFLFLKPASSCFDNKQNSNETGVDCGGSCIPCEQKYAQPLKFNWIKNFSNGENKIILVAEIKNPNLNYTASDFIYTFNVFDKGGYKILTESNHSFIYTSEVKYLLQPIDMKFSDFGRAELDFSNYVWKSKSDFSKPNVVIKEFKTAIYSPQQGLIPFYNFTRILSVGSQGEDVKYLEDYLKSQGYFTGEPDNIFNKITQNSLVKYQKANGISPATGSFNTKTLEFVNSQIAKIQASASQTSAVYPLTIDGVIKNSDTIIISKTIINGFVFDQYGVMMAASKTELENLNPTDEKSFRIIFPKSVDIKFIAPNLTKIYIDAIR